MIAYERFWWSPIVTAELFIFTFFDRSQAATLPSAFVDYSYLSLLLSGCSLFVLIQCSIRAEITSNVTRRSIWFLPCYILDHKLAVEALNGVHRCFTLSIFLSFNLCPTLTTLREQYLSFVFWFHFFLPSSPAFFDARSWGRVLSVPPNKESSRRAWRSEYHHIMVTNFLTTTGKFILSEKGQRTRRIRATFL